MFGIDPGSTRISFSDNLTDEVEGVPNKGTRARITFFILGSSENSLQLRKRLLELAANTIAQKMKAFGIEFTTEEPTIYVESPIANVEYLRINNFCCKYFTFL